MNNSPSPYRRYNPLQDKWVLTSPHRMQRPWSGQTETVSEQPMPEYDPKCYLCPGNTRSGGAVNPKYNSIYTFVNDFSGLLPNFGNENKGRQNSLFIEQNENGICEVICYNPSHNKTMASMSLDEIEHVIKIWKSRYVEIGNQQEIQNIQIFENRGNEVGNSNAHPHGQLWAQTSIPTIVESELRQQKKYFNEHGSPLLLDYVKQELELDERILYKNEDFVLLVPFWVEWPYETLILPTFPLTGLNDLDEAKFKNLSILLQNITKAYGVLFKRPLYGAPYTMGIHQQPTDGKDWSFAQLHMHFQPPLLTADRQKFMVGYERFAEAQRDLTAEQAAGQLKEIIKNL